MTPISVAPSYPPLSDLILAMDLFALCGEDRKY